MENNTVQTWAEIEPIAYPLVGNGFATRLDVKSLPFDASDKTAELAYTLSTSDGEVCTNSNYSMTEAEFANWGTDNNYLYDLIAATSSLIKIVSYPTDTEE